MISPMIRLSVCGCLLCLTTHGFAQQVAKKETTIKSSLPKRVPWTTSRVAGSPEPPAAYQVELAFPNLKFQQPLVMTNAPGTDRLFVAERGGKIYRFANDPQTDKLDLVIDLKQARPGLAAIYGLAFHPDFKRNRFVYICYIVSGDPAQGTQVSRFTISAQGTSQIDPKSERKIIAWRSGGHNGGCLKFGPDGFLYISTGDAAGPAPPDKLRAGQDVSNLLSSILRIDVDSTDKGKAYRIPPDNPFVDLAGARGEIWSYGFRNPWKMSFDSQAGHLWVGDVGWEQWEMIHRVQKGGNYGWSVKEGRQVVLPGQKRGPTPILPPIVEHPHSEAASITGGFVYHGSRLKGLRGAYIYGDFQTGKVWALRDPDGHAPQVEELANTPLQLVGFGEDNAGEIYLLDYDRSKQIYRLAPNTDTGNHRDFPRKLSQTGLFSSLKNETPAAGVIGYSVNARHWADHTHSKRWLAVPGVKQIKIDGKGNLKFPDGSVLAKTVSIEMKAGAPESSRRLETQILHRESGSWRPYTYVWNDQQTDALLAGKNGFSRTLSIRDPQAPGGQREQTYHFAARAQCLTCHNPWIGTGGAPFGVQTASPLAVNIRQLNRDHSYGNRTANQLSTFTQIGLIAGKISESVRSAQRIVDPYDEAAELNARARAYLHVNCSHCHLMHAGGGANILLSHDLPLEKTQTIDVRPSLGTFGITGARIIAPGDPFGSLLYYRITKMGGGRMPRVGSREVDTRAEKLFYDWISQLPPVDRQQPSGGSHALQIAQTTALETVRKSKSTQARKDAIGQLTASTRGAMALLRLKDHGRLSLAADLEIVAATKDHPQSEVRDLFERFVPASQRVKRLGSVVNQAEILSLRADAARGRAVFFGESAGSCKSCHRINNNGGKLGPDLSHIAKKYSRAQLLQHILEPSKFIDPKYVSYLLETAEGSVLTGLLAEKTATEVVLKTSQDKLLRFKTEEVELLLPQQKSIMPELLLRDMTRQRVADLLAYLASLK